MKKYLLGALSLPIMMASCTQDVLENEMVQGNLPNAKGFNLEIKVDEDKSAETRSYYAEDLAMKFKAADGDKLSMFWLGTTEPSAEYSQSFNSIFNIETEGDGETSSFRSPSMVYTGHNVVVYPADITTVKTGKIVLTVENDNSKNGIKNYPFISNLLDLEYSQTSNSKNDKWLTNGYNNSLVLPMKQAANYAEINLNVKNIATGIEGYENGVEIQNITFTANSPVFAESANIKSDTREVKYSGWFDANPDPDITDEYTPIIKSTYPVAVSTAKVNNLQTKAVAVTHNDTKNAATGTGYLMTFPTQEYAKNFGTAVTDGTITVTTNMGTVTLRTGASETVDGNVTYPKSPVLNGANKVSIESWMNGLSTYRIQTVDKSNFKNEIIGTRFARTLNVDMNEAKLDGSIVYKSTDIIRYIALHKAIESDEDVELVMHAKFEGLTKAAVEALAKAEKFTLKANENVTLLGGGNVADYMLAEAKFTDKPTTYTLASGKWTAAEGMDDKLTTNPSFVNNGELTLTNVDGNTFGFALTNNGMVKVADGAVITISGEYTANEGSTTSVRQSAELWFTDDANINGTVLVHNDFIAAETANVTFGKKAVVTNKDLIATNGTGASIVNMGTITNYSSNARTLITDNEGTVGGKTVKGTIVLSNRDDQITIGNSAKPGYVSIKASQLNGTFEAATGDKMNKIVIDQDGKFTFKTNNRIAFVDVEANASIVVATGGDIVFAGLKVADSKELYIDSGNKVRVKPDTYSGAHWNCGTVTCEGTTIGEKAKIIVAGSFEYGTCDNVNGFYQAGSGVVKP